MEGYTMRVMNTYHQLAYSNRPSSQIRFSGDPDVPSGDAVPVGVPFEGRPSVPGEEPSASIHQQILDKVMSRIEHDNPKVFELRGALAGFTRDNRTSNQFSAEAVDAFTTAFNKAVGETRKPPSRESL